MSEPLVRSKPGVPTAESDCSCWPTPTVHGNYNRQGASPKAGWGLAALALDRAHLWYTQMTPTGGRVVSDAVVRAKGRVAGGKRTVGLESQARFVVSSGQACDHQGQASQTPGSGSQPTTRTRSLRLNPVFVEWLMGFPRGWSLPFVGTDSAASGTR